MEEHTFIIIFCSIFASLFFVIILVGMALKSSPEIIAGALTGMVALSAYILKTGVDKVRESNTA